MDWDKLRIFHAVADEGSITNASTHLNLSQSAISRQIRALEESLNAILFHRHARGLLLTEQGELLFSTTVAMSKQLESATAGIRDTEDELFGELRVTTTNGFGALWLAPRLPHLYSKYPEIKIDLVLAERVLDLSMRQADLAIRMKEPTHVDLIRKKLMTARIRLYASRKYLAQVGAPAGLCDFCNHRLVCQRPSSYQAAAGAALVEELLSNPIKSIVTVNSYYGVLQGVCHDLGIGVLPDYITEDFPDLERVLPELESEAVPVFLAYPEELRHSKRVAAFRDFVQEEIIQHRAQLRKLGKL
ncbi:MAG: LysR family transcriptional regulator [Aestuariivita sp.]|nr:LysR family transcriptional regulator [Aestuariivita sp.]MCY4202276.1 LysR family transcriptional regulator [Aestuariivita sp.]MCY4289886.1 LysR family transcriptional regulator [Aestuariivita sp.]MCY4346722.1 LysR family transcriptional regulator [Aestuariivita sp.]